MSDLTTLEKRKLERLLQMSGGYVLNFSNRTFDEFVIETTGRSIYDERYGNGSKANQLRGFWREESNPLVARFLGRLLDYAEGEQQLEDPALLAECRRIVARLEESNPVAEIDAIARIAEEHDLEIVARAVLENIEKNEFVVGLDRLHTLTTGFLRKLCEKRGLTVEQGKPLHSLFGQYVRTLYESGCLESRMTASILKALNGPLDAFNDVRNNQSLAHDNSLLNHEEAMLIFNHVTSALRFLRDLEHRVQRRKKAAADRVAQAAASDDDIPF
ncbi:MAG TPA: abortive infection family protein [Polyangiaceae bacterium]|nr:abortive infection family protein [Polyangiaceae bacterium]